MRGIRPEPPVRIISALLIDKHHTPLLNLGFANGRLRIPGNIDLQLLIWDFHFQRTFEPLYADVEIISTCFPLTEFSVIKKKKKNKSLPAGFSCLGTDTFWNLAPGDGLFNQVQSCDFSMTLLILPEI